MNIFLKANKINNPLQVTYLLLFFICSANYSTPTYAQNTRYNYENITNNGLTFNSSSQTFSLSGNMIGVVISTFGSELNLGDQNTSNGYMDTGFSASNTGNVGGINAPTGLTFRAKGFDVWPSANQGGAVLPEGEMVQVIGLNNNVQVVTATVATTDFGQNTSVDVRWFRIDLSTTSFNTTDIDAVQFVMIGTQDYIAVDNFIYSNLQVAVTNTPPVIGGTVANQNVNDNSTLNPFSLTTISDTDGDNLTTTVTLDNNTKGVFTAGSLTASGFTGSGPYTLASTTAANAQTAIRQLVFNPTNNRVNVGTTETTTFTINLADATSNDVDTNTSVISTSINDVGVAFIVGNVVIGSTLTAGLTDTDGINNSSFSYQWKRNTVNIATANSSNYQLIQVDVGSTITVTISYTDDLAQVESPTSPATNPVAGDDIFANGFETVVVVKYLILDYLDSIQKRYPEGTPPIYDFESDSVYYKGYSLFLDNEYSNEKSLISLKTWLNDLD